MTANTSALWQQAAHTTDQFTSPSCWRGAIQKSLPLNKKYWRNFWRKKSQKNGPAGRKKDSRSNRTLQKKKREDSKVESNDSPEIPDMRVTSGIPGLPSEKWFCVEWWNAQWFKSNSSIPMNVICFIWQPLISLIISECAITYFEGFV